MGAETRFDRGKGLAEEGATRMSARWVLLVVLFVGAWSSPATAAERVLIAGVAWTGFDAALVQELRQRGMTRIMPRGTKDALVLQVTVSAGGRIEVTGQGMRAPWSEPCADCTLGRLVPRMAGAVLSALEQWKKEVTALVVVDSVRLPGDTAQALLGPLEEKYQAEAWEGRSASLEPGRWEKLRPDRAVLGAVVQADGWLAVRLYDPKTREYRWPWVWEERCEECMLGQVAERLGEFADDLLREWQEYTATRAQERVKDGEKHDGGLNRRAWQAGLGVSWVATLAAGGAGVWLWRLDQNEKECCIEREGKQWVKDYPDWGYYSLMGAAAGGLVLSVVLTSYYGVKSRTKEQGHARKAGISRGAAWGGLSFGGLRVGAVRDVLP
jgi:hypothetical protein